MNLELIESVFNGTHLYAGNNIDNAAFEPEAVGQLLLVYCVLRDNLYNRICSEDRLWFVLTRRANLIIFKMH